MRRLRDTSNPFEDLIETRFISFFRLPKTLAMHIIDQLAPLDESFGGIEFYKKVIKAIIL